MAEVGADQLLLRRGDVAGQVELRLHLLEALLEHAARLPVARTEILVHEAELGLRGAHVHGQHRLGDPPRAHGLHRGLAGNLRRDDLERADHHPAGLGVEPGLGQHDLGHTASRATGGQGSRALAIADAAARREVKG